MYKLITAGVLALMVQVSAWASGPVMLNQATADELAAIEKVSGEDAKAIVELRSKRGRLNSVEELRILRLEESTLDALRTGTRVAIELPVDGSRKTYSSTDEVMAEFAWEPDIAQVQTWANDYAQMSPQQVERWLRQSKSFAALPQLTLEFRLNDGWDQDFQYASEVTGGDPLTADEALFNYLDQAGTDQDARYLVRARWDLNELIMSSERIRIINEAQDIVKLRDKILGEVTRLYFERRRVQVDMLLTPKGDLMGQVKDELRLLELTAGLDALTGGAFSQALARSGKQAATTSGKPAPQ